MLQCYCCAAVVLLHCWCCCIADFLRPFVFYVKIGMTTIGEGGRAVAVGYYANGQQQLPRFLLGLALQSSIFLILPPGPRPVGMSVSVPGVLVNHGRKGAMMRQFLS